MPSSLPTIERRPVGRREQQRAQRFGLAFAFERARRARAFRKTQWQSTGCPPTHRRPTRPSSTKRERKHEHARHREEHRRRDELPAAHLDGEVLAHDEPGDAEEGGHDAFIAATVALAQVAAALVLRGPAVRCAGRAPATAGPRRLRDRASRARSGSRRACSALEPRRPALPPTPDRVP